MDTETLVMLYLAKKAADVVVGEELKKVWSTARDKAIENVHRIWTRASEIGGGRTEELSTGTVLALVQNGGGIDDPDIQEMFARLVATEMRGKQAHPSFVRILGEMTPDEARVFRQVTQSGTIVAGRTQSGKVVLSDRSIPEEAVISLIHADLVHIQPAFGAEVAMNRDEVEAVERNIVELGEVISGGLEKYARLILTTRGRRFAWVVLSDHSPE